MSVDVEVLADDNAVAVRAAQVVEAEATAAISDHDRFTIAVSGGKTPWRMFARLAETMSFTGVTMYQVDERIAPDGDPDRNLTHLLASLPDDSGAEIRPMPVTASDLDAAAAQYAASLPDEIDLVHLGLGPDGHTASLVPGDAVLLVTDRDVAVTGKYQGHRRMTMTYTLLSRAPRVLWLVVGEDKAAILPRLLEGDPSIPASKVSRAHALVLCDEAAASELAGDLRAAGT